MIPTIISQQVKRGIIDFLLTTFPSQDPVFGPMVTEFLQREQTLFKGPYLTLKLPFLQGTIRENFFPDVPTGFIPYLHQQKSFLRLQEGSARSTLVATGTGSGKTECFLYPILDYCYRHRGEPGIKAVVIYPMNALANDQAGRFAKTIFKNSKLKGNVSVGLYIGGESRDTASSLMTEDHVITDKALLREVPPDILLTNYKMLDLLLIRQEDSAIWKDNSTESLKYLAVDELHTFDGAQGTDLACLIRRLKHRLGTPADHLCCIGTSATIGGPEEREPLRAYAQAMFQEPFDAESIIIEENQSPAVFLQDEEILYEGISGTDPDVLDISSYTRAEAYIAAQAQLWFGMKVKNAASTAWRRQLSGFLKHHDIFQQFLLQLNGRILTEEELTAVLRSIIGEEAEPDYVRQLALSLISLVTWARDPDQERESPFLHVRYQLWLREMRRMVSEVSLKPHLEFYDDLHQEPGRQYLPVVYCNECGAAGWGAVRRESEIHYQGELERFYNAFFGYSKDTYYLYPREQAHSEWGSEDTVQQLCPECLAIEAFRSQQQCGSCGHTGLITVQVHNPRVTTKERTYGTHDCPFCGGHNSLTIAGRRSSSLISVALSQLFASSFNDDKKVLTFSDSVQDASHRAGFFAARTWRFNFRTALKQFLDTRSIPLTLSEAGAEFSRWWSRRWEDVSEHEKYLATFTPPDMEWLHEFRKFQKEGITRSTGDLRKLVDQRLNWEITSEFGFSALIGRTLEKTASATASFPLDFIGAAAVQIQRIIEEEIEGISIPAPALIRYLTGLLAGMKLKGAVDHPALKRYIESSCNPYLFSNIGGNELYMPRMGSNSRLPEFFVISGGSNRQTNLISRSSTPTWNQDWLYKTLAGEDSRIAAYDEQVVSRVITVLKQHHLLLGRYGKRNEELLTLNPEYLQLSTAATVISCKVCSHTLTIPEADESIWIDMPCQRYGCSGSYQQAAEQEDYYRRLYEAGDIERIFSREHTGLLSRSVREEIEHQFITHQRPTDPNVLSCTPTLEMGINIGDLSSAILCSVPPSQAQYLQRIGRTGRTDGNSFILTVAEGAPHDQFFFSQPLDMISGTVSAPYIYLNAPAVLERQFVAFCFDVWIASPGTVMKVPRMMEEILTAVEHANTSAFPYTFFSFISLQRHDLLEAFSALFAAELDVHAEAYLRSFVLGNEREILSLEEKLLSTIHKLKTDQDGLTARWKQYGKAVREMKKKAGKGDKNYHDDLQHMIQERSALHSFIKRNKKKQTYNFLTDEGFLPNYAFPEAGVLLRSIILYKKSVPDGHGKYRKETFEYERPARSAIRELAPDNTFYAEGRKVVIDQIDVTASEVTQWHLCDQCSYAVPEAAMQAVKTCPRCGSPMWADVSRTRSMIRLSQVYATTLERESRTFDESETREPLFYNQHVLVDIDRDQILESWQLVHEQLPFGFEFIKQTAYREINFGPLRNNQDTMVIDGKEIEITGFTVCKECGKVQNGNGSRDNDKPQHAVTCSHFRAHTPPPPEAYYEGIFLYREFSSESIRILLPVTALTDERSIESLIAALFLGLKKKFGNIDHISSTLVSSPVEGGGDRRSYLILFDTVPGGTGYLKQLMKQPEEMIDVLQRSLDTMRSCTCTTTDKDGCYRCLLAYRRSRKQNLTSRSLAVEIISTLLSGYTEIRKVTSLDAISFNKLYDSELEMKFIDTLRGSRAPISGSPVSLQKYLPTPGGNPGWFMTIGGAQYLIEPQVSLGPAVGLQHPSKPDFMIYPRIPGKPEQGRLPIAVFTDGYQYHKDSIDADTAKRMDLVQSSKYRVWSITWDDLNDKTESLLYPQQSGSFHQALAVYELEHPEAFLGKNSFQLLLLLLEEYNQDAWQKFSAALAMTFAKPRPLEHKDPSSLQHFWHEYTLHDEYEGVGGTGAGETAAGAGRVIHACEGVPVVEHIGFFARQGGKKPEKHDFFTYLVFHDQDAQPIADAERKRLWNGFLYLYNILQFLPNTKALSSRGIAKGLYWGITFSEFPVEQPAAPELAEIMELTDHRYDVQLLSLQRAGKPLPEPFYELTGARGECLAQAELAWAGQKAAIVNAADLPIWKAQGWFAVARNSETDPFTILQERM